MRILLLIPIILAVGCSTMEPKIITEHEYHDVLVPVSNVPIPPNTDCPTDALKGINRGVSDGELVKAYRIAVLQLRDCSTLRQKVIDKYREIAKEDATRINALETTPVSASAPFGSSGPIVNPASVGIVSGIDQAHMDLDMALAEFNAIIDDAAKSLKQKVNDKYKGLEKVNAPVSASGPIVAPSSGGNSSDYPEDELRKELGLGPAGSAVPMSAVPPTKEGNTFDDIESEFTDLSGKDYELDENI